MTNIRLGDGRPLGAAQDRALVRIDPLGRALTMFSGAMAFNIFNIWWFTMRGSIYTKQVASRAGPARFS